ncbi:MAG: hypothetical protein M5U28_49905 [Sandaracinaceae bacterium]|nr:hypothetical protein [Sandaracinaceae bacterium]
MAGAPVACDDGVDCTRDACVESTRSCESVPDSSRCRPGSMCVPGVGCTAIGCGTDAECDDGFVCNGAERCAGGLCTPGEPPRCADDGIGCTIEECSEPAGGLRQHAGPRALQRRRLLQRRRAVPARARLLARRARRVLRRARLHHRHLRTSARPPAATCRPIATPTETSPRAAAGATATTPTRWCPRARERTA